MMTGTAADPHSLEKLFLALGDKTRLKLLALMADGPIAVGVLADRLGESQPKVSRHLAYMRESGIVTTRRDGKWIYYEIDYPTDAGARNVLETVVGALSGNTLPTRNVSDAQIRRPEYVTLEESPKIASSSEVYSGAEIDKQTFDREATGELEVFLL